jgi:outer membrane receptor for ferrienterochelin and colicins
MWGLCAAPPPRGAVRPWPRRAGSGFARSFRACSATTGVVLVAVLMATAAADPGPTSGSPAPGGQESSARRQDAGEPARPRDDEGVVADATPDATDDATTDSGEIIVVTATRSETPRQASPVTTEVIERQRLEESGAQTAAEALALRPGLWVDRGVAGTNGLSMQGLGPQYSLILVDGARQIGRTDGVLDLDRFAVEDLEQIEIVRGPSSVLYGSDALGGVVNLVTRTPRDGLAVDALARIDGKLGHEARGRIAGGGRGYGGTLVASYRNAPAITLDDATGVTAFDAYEDRHVTGRVTLRRSEAWRLEAGADYLRRDLRGVNASATGGRFDRRNLVENVATMFRANWSAVRTAVRIEADASMYRDQFLSDQRMSDALDQYQLTDESLLEARAQVAHHFDRHRIVAGGEVLREALDSDRIAEPGHRRRAALYLQDEWRVGENDSVLVVPAARLDVDSQFGTHATPRLAGRWQISEHSVARGSVGMGYRAPSFKEMLLLFQNPGAGYIVEGNPELDPETSISVQAGGEWQATSWLWFGADAYANRLRDMIFVVALPDDGSGTLQFGYDNIGRARTVGLEGYAIATHGRAAVELGYALTRTRDLDAERPLEGVPAHRLTVTARWRDKAERLDAFAAAVFTGHRPLYLSDDPQLPTLTSRRLEIRARVAKRFRSGFGGFLGVDNILNAGDATLDRLPPRTLYAGVEVHR